MIRPNRFRIWLEGTLSEEPVGLPLPQAPHHFIVGLALSHQMIGAVTLVHDRSIALLFV